mmetsp:Transcript_34555/g.87163  ORF Transcript_34555/g.87163 Transcript_34555/m.87163 type:complete len:688 (-) Transcript_34555:3050-5113(-)
MQPVPHHAGRRALHGLLQPHRRRAVVASPGKQLRRLQRVLHNLRQLLPVTKSAQPVLPLLLARDEAGRLQRRIALPALVQVEQQHLHGLLCLLRQPLAQLGVALQHVDRGGVLLAVVQLEERLAAPPGGHLRLPLRVCLVRRRRRALRGLLGHSQAHQNAAGGRVHAQRHHDLAGHAALPSAGERLRGQLEPLLPLAAVHWLWGLGGIGCGRDKVASGGIERLLGDLSSGGLNPHGAVRVLHHRHGLGHERPHRVTRGGVALAGQVVKAVVKQVLRTLEPLLRAAVCLCEPKHCGVRAVHQQRLSHIPRKPASAQVVVERRALARVLIEDDHIILRTRDGGVQMLQLLTQEHVLAFLKLQRAQRPLREPRVLRNLLQRLPTGELLRGCLVILNFLDEAREYAPLALRRAVMEEVHQEHVIEFQPLGLAHRHDDRAALLQLPGQRPDAVHVAHQDDLVRAKLNLRRVTVAPGKQDGDVIHGQRGQQQRGRPIEERALAVQVIDVSWEVVLQQVNDAAGHVDDAAVCAVVRLQMLNGGDANAVKVALPAPLQLPLLLRLLVEQRADVGEAEPDAARNGLTRVAAVEEAVGVDHAAHVEQQLRLGKVLNLVPVQAVNHRTLVALCEDGAEDVRNEVHVVKEAILVSEHFVALEDGVDLAPLVVAKVRGALCADGQVVLEGQVLLGRPQSL